MNYKKLIFDIKRRAHQKRVNKINSLKLMKILIKMKLKKLPIHLLLSIKLLKKISFEC